LVIVPDLKLPDSTSGIIDEIVAKKNQSEERLGS